MNAKIIIAGVVLVTVVVGYFILSTRATETTHVPVVNESEPHEH
jgi:hypothetical protein